MKLTAIVVPWLLACWFPFAQADDTLPARTDLTALSHEAERWLKAAVLSAGTDPAEQVQVQSGALDPRTRLNACRQPLAFELAPGQALRGKTSLSVRCPDTPGWRLFLPMSIRRQTAVWVARNSLMAGIPLQSGQWQREWRDIASLPASAITADTLEGYETKQPIAAGAVLSDALVSGRTIVKRGQHLTLVSSLGGVAISVTVEALAPGAAGDRITVRNPGSGRIVEAQIVSAEQAKTLP